MQLPLKTLIVDNEPELLSELRDFLADHTDIINIVEEASSFAEAESILKREIFDLTILDVELGKSDCFDLIKSVGKNRFRIIALNASKGDFSGEKSHDLGPFKWILKPYSTSGVEIFINELKGDPQIKSNQPKNSYTLFHEGSHAIIPYEEIWFIEASVEYSKIYCKGQDNKQAVFIVRSNIGSVYEELDHDIFKKCHRSFVVNVNHVKRYKLDGEGGFLYFNSYKNSTDFFEDPLNKTGEKEIRFSESFKPWLIEYIRLKVENPK